MEERKRLAKEISSKFIVVEIPFYAIELLFVVLAGLGIMLQNSTLLLGGLAACIVFLIIMGIICGQISTARRLMVARALVGFEISSDPVKEGMNRVKKHGGYFEYRRTSRSFCVIMNKMLAGLDSATKMMEQIPYVGKLAAIANHVVNRAYRNTTDLLVTYQMACYETTDKGQFYDLLTLLLQHGKDYIMKIVKVEVRNYVATYLPAVVSVVTFIIYYINKSPLFLVIAVICGAATFAADIYMDEKADRDILCDYIEYVQSHEVDQNLRNKVANGLEISDDLLRVNDAVNYHNSQNDYRAAKSIEDIAHRLG